MKKIPLRKLRENDTVYLGHIQCDERGIEPTFEKLTVIEVVEDERSITLSCNDEEDYDLLVKPLSEQTFFADSESIITTNRDDLVTWFDKELEREIQILKDKQEMVERRWGGINN